jgi:hydroxymethylbilane synthase
MHPGLFCELVIIKTKGDKILDVPLAKVGGKGLFIKEIENALLDGSVDLAVHSMKDVPAEIPRKLVMAAIPKREDPRDVLVSRRGGSIASLPRGARVGTSSLRRASQVMRLVPDAVICPLRGNVGTRLEKLESENLDAILLAAAGIKRLGLADRVSQYLDPDSFLPAVGQGALGIEVRKDDSKTLELVAPLNDPETALVVEGERALLHTLGGSCQIPVAGYGFVKDKRFFLSGMVASTSGSPFIKESMTGLPENARQIGKTLANRLLEKGGRKILEELLACQSPHPLNS